MYSVDRVSFNFVIDWDYEEQRLLRELEEVRRCKAEAHLTIEERTNIVMERLKITCDKIFGDIKDVEIPTDGKES